MVNSQFKNYLIYILLSIVIFFPIFYNITELPIIQWDEARLAINSFEMWQNNNYIVTYFNGQPDMWNTKPPLMIWLQSYFTNILGPGELAVRMPSALAAIVVCFSIFWLFKKYFKDQLLGLSGVLCLLCSSGYMSVHGVRTGDYDSLMTLLTTLYIFLFFLYLTENKKIYLYLFFTSLTLATLTKGIAGLLFTPALIIFALYKKQLITILKTKDLYFGLIGFFTIVLGYYFLREAYNPGYLKAVVDNELLGRYMEVNESHSAPFSYYFDNLVKGRYPLVLFIIAATSPLLYYKDKGSIIKDLVWYIWLSATSFLLVISISKTKLSWYDLPVFPLLAILAAVGIHKIVEIITQTYNNLDSQKIYIFFGVIVLTAIPGYTKVLRTSLGYIPTEESIMERYKVSKYFQQLMSGNAKYDAQYAIYLKDSYTGDHEYYKKVLEQKGININLVNIYYDNPFNSHVITGIKGIKDELEEIYDSKQVFTNDYVYALELSNQNINNKLADYDLAKYIFNSKGLKVVPNSKDLSKVMVMIDKSKFNLDLYISYHGVEKVNGAEKFVIRDIGIWNGIDYNNNYSYKIVRLDGEFMRTAIGQTDPQNPSKNWEEWFSR